MEYWAQKINHKSLIWQNFRGKQTDSRDLREIPITLFLQKSTAWIQDIN